MRTNYVEAKIDKMQQNSIHVDYEGIETEWLISE